MTKPQTLAAALSIFTPLSPDGGEPLQPFAVCDGAGSQLHLHGLPQRDPEGDPGPWPLRRGAHHLSARLYRAIPSASLLPFPHPTWVCVCTCEILCLLYIRFVTFLLHVIEKVLHTTSFFNPDLLFHSFFLFSSLVLFLPVFLPLINVVSCGRIYHHHLHSSAVYLSPEWRPLSISTGRPDLVIPNIKVCLSIYRPSSA